MKTIEKIAMGCKPDPYSFKLVRWSWVNGNTIIMANYPGCTSFGGDKLMLLRGEFEPNGLETLDPHFLDEEYAVIGRFVPNEDGWRMAEICALSLPYET